MAYTVRERSRSCLVKGRWSPAMAGRTPAVAMMARNEFRDIYMTKSRYGSISPRDRKRCVAEEWMGETRSRGNCGVHEAFMLGRISSG